MTVDHSRFATATDGVYESLIIRIQEQLIKIKWFLHIGVHSRPGFEANG